MFATFGLVALPRRLLPIDPAAYAVVLLVGLAVGVDYTMFFCAASGKNEPPDAPRRPRSRPRPRHPDGQC